MTGSSSSEAIATLEAPDSTLSEMLAALSALDSGEHSGPTIKLGIAANITVGLLADYLRRYAYLAGVRLEVIQGSYDDLLNDTNTFVSEEVDYLLIIPFFDNLQPAWECQLDGLTPEARRAPALAWLSTLKLALEKASTIGSVIVAGSHSWSSAVQGIEQESIAEFNVALADLAEGRPNADFFDTALIVRDLGERVAFDRRFYYRAKAPYTPAFLNEFARRFAVFTRGFGTYYYKLIALDCDNTLWGGIIGEDGLGGIALDPHSYPGNIYWIVQHQLRQLETQGLLLCLCSKNNPADVDEVIECHPNMVLGKSNFVARKVNWDNKVDNLRALSKDLNLGLESFIFIDDSPFELDAVRAQLPQVRTFQVPEKLAEYPALMREIMDVCLAAGVNAESKSKTTQYRQLALAAAAQDGFADQEAYLRSLQLKVRLHRDAREQTARIAELTQKSNQFNLTTRRYTAGEITALMDRADATVYSFEVSDRFGDSGVTGVMVLDLSSEDAVVDAFLMSCRVIGRGVEYALWPAVFADIRKNDKKGLTATYEPTAKNTQVQDFFDKLGFTTMAEVSESGKRTYYCDASGSQLTESEWVELIDD